MSSKPDYSSGDVQIRIRSDVHKQLRETARRQFGTESVPWSVVLEQALDQFEREEKSLPEIVE